MRQLQNDQKKSGCSTKNHRSNMPPDSAFTYGLINTFSSFSLQTLNLLLAVMINAIEWI